jgi:hypothetical protein
LVAEPALRCRIPEMQVRSGKEFELGEDWIFKDEIAGAG